MGCNKNSYNYKKTKCFLAALVIFTLISALFAACSANQTKLGNRSDEIAVGVIETTGYKNKSYLHFYDENLNFLYKEENKYSSLSEPFDAPQYQNGKLYTIPKGKFEVRNEHCILEYDIASNQYREYNTGLRAMKRLVVTQKYLFGVNTIDGVSTISRCEIGTDNEISVRFTGKDIVEMKVLDGALFVIWNDIKASTVHFIKLSVDDLTELENYDITAFGSPADLVKHEDNIYMSYQYSDDVLGIVSDKITVFSCTAKTFSQITLKENSPNDMIIHQDTIMVSHYDRVQGEGNKLSFYNLTTAQSEVIELTHSVKEMLSDGEFLYILGDHELFKYAINENSLTKLCAKPIQPSEKKTFFYINSFFVCN